jgi:protein-S-isoprenylcysteine O-methyltransferase Ste14
MSSLINNELFFHLVFVGVFVAFTVVRALYQRAADQTQGQVEFKEGIRHRALRLVFGIPFMLIVVAYMIRPGILAWAKAPLPLWLQWLGVILGLASIPLIWWVQQALGSNFSTTLHVRQEHTLVTHGPYRWVRHPMYTVLYIHFLAVFLLTSNWLIGGGFLGALTLIVATRTRREEATMIEKFGQAYRDYMSRTGRFLPRLAWK